MIQTPLKQIPNKPVVVVEIGNDWLKIIEYNPSYKGGCITKASFMKLVEIKEPVTEAIAKAFAHLKLNKQFVITYLPRHLVTARILEFPSTNPDDIRDMVSLQVGKQTPYSKDEIIFTYKTINVEKEGYTKVLLIIVRRNLVNARVEVLQKAGIEVQKVTVSSEGVYNWFQTAYLAQVSPTKDKVYDGIKLDLQAMVIIDIDSNYSDFIVIRRDKLVYTRNFLIGANHLLSADEKWKDKFAEEVSHSMSLYQNEERDAKMIKIFLSGTAQHVQGLDAFLTATLNMPVEMTDPLKNIRIRENIDIFQNKDYQFISICPLVGTALRSGSLELDLTSSELKIKKQVEEKRKKITVMGGLLTSLVMTASLLLLIIFYNKNAYVTQLNQRMAAIEKDADEVEKMRLGVNLVEDRFDARKKSLNILYEISRLTPKEIYFSNIDIEEEKQTILQGRAYAMSNVFEFVTTLENSPYFENVQTTYTTTKKEKEGEYAKFEIICMQQRDGLYEVVE